MTTVELRHIITTQKPAVLYISGKTSTGKSTFARRLQDELGYRIIELEAVLLAMVKERHLDEQMAFRTVLGSPDPSELRALFVEATDHIITEALAHKQPLVIEGAIAHTPTLQRVLEPAKNCMFIYFHPVNQDTYVRNLSSRFATSLKTPLGGLPHSFWKHIDPTEYELYRKTHVLSPALQTAIRTYADESQKESRLRLNDYQKTFGEDILVVDVQ